MLRQHSADAATVTCLTVTCLTLAAARGVVGEGAGVRGRMDGRYVYGERLGELGLINRELRFLASELHVSVAARPMWRGGDNLTLRQREVDRRTPVREQVCEQLRVDRLEEIAELTC